MTEPKQIDKFREMAKELECNESEKDFDKKLGRLVKEKPNKKSPS
jgi:phage regulator Rha-like protein